VILFVERSIATITQATLTGFSPVAGILFVESAC
jgi:hypothetical protein